MKWIQLSCVDARSEATGMIVGQFLFIGYALVIVVGNTGQEVTLVRPECLLA